MSTPPADPRLLPAVRGTVREILDQTKELAAQPELRNRLARSMVRVALTAAGLIAEEDQVQAEIDQRLKQEAGAGARARPGAGALAEAQAARDLQGGGAVASAGQRVRELREGLAFPEFVTNLITGVFQAITSSGIQQLEAVADLLQAVDMSAGDFAEQQIDQDRAARWMMGRFGVFTIERSANAPPRIVLGPDREMPTPEVLREALEASEDEVSAVDEDDLAGTLLPLVRRKLGRDRQKMLSTMLLMGLHRVVVDEGRLHASMDMRVDARSIAEHRQQEQFDMRVDAEAKGSFGVGAWGASAALRTSVGLVKADEQVSREDIQASAGLRSSVDLAFRTEPIVLERMASADVRAKLATQSLSPSWESQSAAGPASATVSTTRTDLTAANPRHTTLAAPEVPAPGSNPRPSSPAPSPSPAPTSQTP